MQLVKGPLFVGAFNIKHATHVTSVRRREIFFKRQNYVLIEFVPK